MADTPVARLYSSSGDSLGDLPLDPALFGIEPNVAVMHQVVTAQLAAARRGTASTKTRGEVRGGGRKPWRQKGLGRARHGSTRSPQWRGGGVVFGPKPRDYSQRTPKKMRRLALRSALSVRASEGQVVAVEAFDWDVPKTKAAATLLDAMGVTGKALLVLGPDESVAAASARNLPTVRVITAGQLNTYDVLWGSTIVFSRAALEGSASANGDGPATEAAVEDEAEAS